MRNRLLLIAIAIGLAGAITFLIFQHIGNVVKREEQKRSVLLQQLQPVSVAVATQDITKRGTIISEDMVTVEEVAGLGLQPYAIHDPREVIGKEPLAPIAQGQQFVRNLLVSPGAAGGALAAKIPTEKRAISIEINVLTGVSGFIRPSDRVDILWTFAVPGQQGSQAVTITLFQNIEVLALGQQMNPRGESEGVEARTLTLALTPHEAELLLFASQQGRLQLSLRSARDSEYVALPPATMDAVLQLVLPQAAATSPAKPPRHIEIIRGKKKEVLTLTSEGIAVSPAPQAADAAADGAAAGGGTNGN